MAELPQPNDEQKPLRIRRGRVDSVDLFEIKDTELDLLERGSPYDLQLNFGIFLASCALTGIGTLATATFSNETIKTIFVVVTVVGILVGAFLFLSWFRNRTSMKDVCAKIRRRIPPDINPDPPAGPPSPE